MKKTLLAAALVCAVILSCSCSKTNSSVREGSLAQFDTLSYALGANIGNGMKYQFGDIPMDYDRFYEGFKQGVFDKSTLTRSEMLDLLGDYFRNKRFERSRAVMLKRMKADSVRMAQGDSTRMEYEADESMFATPGERDSISYALGADIGYNIREDGMPVQTVWVLEGMKEVQQGDSLRMDEQQINAYLQHYFNVTRPAENAKASEEWLREIESKSGVKKTESGLLYKITKQGDESVRATDKRDQVRVLYKGTTRTGKVFDASRYEDLSSEDQETRKRFNPEHYAQPDTATFQLARVIPGWTEGMQLVGKGGRITLWVPSNLAYGERAAGRKIGPNEALKFEVELIDVIPYVDTQTSAPVVTPQTAADQAE